MKGFNGLLGALCIVVGSTVANAHDTNWNIGNDITVGAILGGIVGYQVDRDDGAVVGALLGAIAGYHYDHATRPHRHQHFSYSQEQLLRAAIRERIKIETRQITLLSDELFETGNAILTDISSSRLNPVIQVLEQYPRTKVYVNGYTNIAGQEYQNRVRALGQAESVAMYLVINGVQRERITTAGHSSSEPATPRIDLFIEPVFGGSDLNLQ